MCLTVTYYKRIFVAGLPINTKSGKKVFAHFLTVTSII